MKLLLAIAIVAIIIVLVLAMKRGSTRVTHIEQRRKSEDDDAER